MKDQKILLEEDRIFTAKKAGVAPEELLFVGKQSYYPLEESYLFLWTIMNKQSELYLSTISGKKYPIEKGD